MPAKTQDAIALLKADHDVVDKLFDQFEAAKGEAKKQALVKQICTELIIHTMIEEEIFYPALKGKIEEDLLEESYVEHDGAKVLIAELKDAKPDAAFYDAKVKVLSEEIRHHVKEEEAPMKGMFAQARAAAPELMKPLGVQMADRKAALKSRFETLGLPAPTTRTMTGAQVDHLRPTI